MASKNSKSSPKTKLRFDELLEGYSITQLAREMDVTYTQLYPYRKSGANPTLLALENLALGFSKIRGEKISVVDLIDHEEPKKRKK